MVSQRITARRENSQVCCWCFYLPQFHPIPENDAWWGPGFTEWDNVRAAKPLYPGHRQPHEPWPGDYGDYYDLRDPGVLPRQAVLARKYGIFGFVFYHYWFTGRQLLETPLKNLLAGSDFRLPFMLCWANESWTRRWDGLEDDVLLPQSYSPVDDERHIQTLLPIFRDERYYKFRGCPVLMVYRSEELPDPNRTAAIWRREVQKAGFPGLYLLRVEGFEGGFDPDRHGFDASVEFAPDWSCLQRRVYLGENGYWSEEPLNAHPATRDNRVFLYDDVVRRMREKPAAGYRRYPGVFPGWDNSARRRQGGATIIHGATPETFRQFLETAISRARRELPEGERHVFINAWNEWGEGCHLEPDRRDRLKFLEAVSRVSAR